MDRLAAVCERVASRNSRLHKVRLVAEYLRSLDDADLPRAVSILSGRPPLRIARNAELFEEQRHTGAAPLSVGGSILGAACIAATGWDRNIVRICRRETGDSGEAISLLISRTSKNLPLTLARAEEIYTALYGARRAAEKIEILRLAFQSYTQPAIKYFIKAITGNLRIGLQEKMVEEAVTAAMDAPVEAVRQANNRLGNLPQVALAARHKQLDSIKVRLFHPMDFMLAKPIEKIADLNDYTQYAIEDKFDGIRSQVHVEAGQARIYSRGMEEVTAAFPEPTALLRRLEGSAILDGELLAWKNGRALSFALLQQRLARKRVGDDLQERIPVVFMAYDILYRNGELLLDAALERRRALLEQLHAANPGAFLLSAQFRAQSVGEVEKFFEDARAHGNEGLVLKRFGSVYEPAKRSGEWYKLKRPFGTLDVVITAAEQGNGKRASMLSDYTFAVRGENGDYLNVGKAYSGLTDVEIRELTRLLRSLALERYGRVLLVRPEIVLEVAFDGIQKSERHKSGYALRFPRILRWRQDKKAEECDPIERVRQLYEASVQ